MQYVEHNLTPFILPIHPAHAHSSAAAPLAIDDDDLLASPQPTSDLPAAYPTLAAIPANMGGSIELDPLEPFTGK